MIKRKGKLRALFFTAVAATALFIGAGNVKDVQAAEAGPVLNATVEKSFTAEVGDTLTIPVKLSSEKDIRAVTGKLKGQYDDTVLKFEKAVYTDGIPSGIESVAGGNFGFMTSNSFKSGTVNLEFQVLKCAPSPVTVTIKDLYASVQTATDGGTALISTDKMTLTTEVTVNHPKDKIKETVIKEPTCTVKGEKSLHCTVCDTDLGTAEIPAAGHKDGDWKITKEATCTEKGSKDLLCSVCGEVIRTEEIAATGHKDGGWKITKQATCTAKGSKDLLCSVCKAVIKTESIPATGHQYGGWATTTKATAVNAGVQTRTCTKCGAKETRALQKLASTGSLNATSFPLKVKQSATLIVSNMAAGDRVVSWTSSNKKYATVNANGKVTGKKKGTVTITATLASGRKLTAKVKVQTKKVTTSKLTVNTKNVTLKVKQNFQLSTTIAPFTSKDKVTYKTSSKKVATVSKKGKITAKKAGKATITVKAGKKSVKVKVKVTK